MDRSWADEQRSAADTFHAGGHLALQAGAGTGKTTTLALLAHGTTRRGRYLAYHRAIAQDACTRFPSTVQCKTAHALAYAAVGHRYTRRLDAPRRPAWQTGQVLGLTKVVRIGDREISQRALSNATLRTVTRFCHIADDTITRHHVPRLRGLEDNDLHRELASHILPFARRAWADLQRSDDGAVRFDHDHYLKIWALSRPRIGADFLLLDEAQDTNPVVEQVFLAQRPAVHPLPCHPAIAAVPARHHGCFVAALAARHLHRRRATPARSAHPSVAARTRCPGTGCDGRQW